jgi:hypothetical protein
VDAVDPVSLGMHVPRLLATDRVPLRENGREVIAKLGVTPVRVTTAIGNISPVSSSRRHAER